MVGTRPVAAIWTHRIVLGLIDSGTGLHKEVRVIEQIEHLRLNLDGLSLGNMESAGQAEINFVNPRTVERIVAHSRNGTGARDSQSGVVRRFVDSAIVDRVVSTGAAIRQIGASAGAG